jgi:hypothetical protein
MLRFSAPPCKYSSVISTKRSAWRELINNKIPRLRYTLLGMTILMKHKITKNLYPCLFVFIRGLI